MFSVTLCHQCKALTENLPAYVLESVLRPPEEISTSALIDKMFEDVLQAADGEEEDAEEGNDSSISKSIDETDIEVAQTEPTLKSPNPSLGGDEEACDEEQKETDNPNEEKTVADEQEHNAGYNEEDFLSLPPSCVLSPLSKSVEAVVTPMVSRSFMVFKYVSSYTHTLMWF